MHIDPNWPKASAPSSDAPASPAATDVEQDFAFTVAERPMRNRIPRQTASNAPIEISIRIHNPVVYERIDGLRACSILSGLWATRHVERNRLATRMLGKEGDALLYRKMVILLAQKRVRTGA